jgi:MarR family transcriptional regulator, organic hydroperoxide resistance regulator
MKQRVTEKGAWPPKASSSELPFEQSIGYQIRTTHRVLQRFLQLKIEPYGVTLGAWYFLRALWHEDGLTQRELADRSGTREPTALIAIKAMEARGLVKRARSKADRRKIHVWLTPRGRKIKEDLIPLAREVVATAANNLKISDVHRFLGDLNEIQKSLNIAIERAEAAAAKNVSTRFRRQERSPAA